jgi:HAMP domain-containing protein
MTAVVLVNAVAGGVAWSLHARAADQEALAVAAVVRADWVGALTQSVGDFVSEATDLAFGLRGGVSEESSAEYGDLVGADESVSHTLARVPRDLAAADAEAIAAQWRRLRVGVFVWVNAEAAQGGSDVRLTLTEDDRLRASVTSNIATPTPLIGKDGVGLRREVRSNVENFRDGTLRRTVSMALADAETARAAGAAARTVAVNVTLAAIGLSLITAFAAAMWLYGSIAGPLIRAQRVAEVVAGGEYMATFARHGDDEVGALINAVEEMRDTVVRKVEIMREMAGAVIFTAEGVVKSATAARADAFEGRGDVGPALEHVAAQAETLGDLASQMLKA